MRKHRSADRPEHAEYRTDHEYLRFHRRFHLAPLSVKFGLAGAAICTLPAWRSIGIRAGRIAHLLQIFLNLRRYAAKVIEHLVGNPPEVLLAEIELLGIELRVVHG